MLRQASNQRARLQLLEAGSHTKILPEEGQERCRRVMWEAAWAKRQRETYIWETRCWVALLQVYWERVVVYWRSTGQVCSRDYAMEAK